MEFAIQITLVVDARDYDEAVDISRSLRETLRRDADYKVRDVEADVREVT